MGGIMGRLFHEFAMTMAMAIAVSAVVSLDADTDDLRAIYASRPA